MPGKKICEAFKNPLQVPCPDVNCKTIHASDRDKANLPKDSLGRTNSNSVRQLNDRLRAEKAAAEVMKALTPNTIGAPMKPIIVIV